MSALADSAAKPTSGDDTTAATSTASQSVSAGLSAAAAVSEAIAPLPKMELPTKLLQELPENRFELELEFVQSLASPAYLHYLATNPSSDDHNWLDDPEFIDFLRYLLKTWSRPEYNQYLVYPQALYFLEWMLHHRREEWAQVGFRNFAHQQQFMSWQHRASRLYGRGSQKPQDLLLAATTGTDPAPGEGGSEGAGPPQLQGPTMDPATGLEVDPQAMQEG